MKTIFEQTEIVICEAAAKGIDANRHGLNSCITPKRKGTSTEKQTNAYTVCPCKEREKKTPSILSGRDFANFPILKTVI